MSYPKKRYLFFLLLVTAVLFRGQLFRLFISYEPIGHRDLIALTDNDLVHEISDWSAKNPVATPKELIAFARKQTARQASFVMRATSGRPDDVVASGQANCVGYARLFAATLDLADTKNQLNQEILIGQLFIFGQSLHGLTNDPFWSDHDYNKVKDVNSGEVYFLDATLYDYSGIKWVR